MVTIGVDAHKRTHTMVAVDHLGKALAEKTVPAVPSGHAEALRWANGFGTPDVLWAVEDCRLYTRLLEQDLLAARQRVVRVPTIMMAHTRKSSRTWGKSDPIDATAVARAALREPDLPVAFHDDVSWEMKLLLDRRRDLVDQRVAATNRLRQRLHLIDPTVQQPAKLHRPATRDSLLLYLTELHGLIATLARQELSDVDRFSQNIDELTRQIGARVRDTGTTLTQIVGCGEVTAAHLISGVANVTRFRNEAAFARYVGVAPIPEWSGSTRGRVRLSRSGNRRLNAALHIIALVQARVDGPARAYYRRRLEDGDTKAGALRCLKRRICRAVYTRLQADQRRALPDRGSSRAPLSRASPSDAIPSFANQDPTAYADPPAALVRNASNGQRPEGGGATDGERVACAAEPSTRSQDDARHRPEGGSEGSNPLSRHDSPRPRHDAEHDGIATAGGGEDLARSSDPTVDPRHHSHHQRPDHDVGDHVTAPASIAQRPRAPRADVSLSSDWDRTEAIIGAPLRELITGLDDVASFAIPYARLPRRLSTHAADLPRWADVANQTPQALLARPRLGAAAVRALIDAGRAAVSVHRDTVATGKVGATAAVTRMVKQLNDFDQKILSAHVWARDPTPRRVLAVQLGVHQASVTRNIPRARARFAELMADPAHHEVTEHAQALRRRLGPYLPAEVLDVELRRLGLDPSGQTAQVLLYVAGPYAAREDWTEDISVPGGGRAQARKAIDAVFDRDATPTTDALLHVLTGQGMPTGIALTYLEDQVALRRFGDVWVRWAGDNVANMTEAALSVLDAPATARALHATLGAGVGTSAERVNDVLSEDDRFVRASRTTWGLRAWGITEYHGIAHAIGELIDASGGSAGVEQVTGDLLARYPDISEASIRSYVRTQEFVMQRNEIRRRTPADGWRTARPLNTIRGVYLNGPDEIRVVFPVTSELLRGSGQGIHWAVAAAAEMSPGTKRTFTSPHGEVTLSWKASSTRGPNIGPLRPHAEAVDATVADALVVALRLEDSTLGVTRLTPADTGTARLQKLLGRQVRNPQAALAASLDCRPHEVGAVLRARGDHELAAMLAGT